MMDPIQTLHLFEPLEQKLIVLLRSLSPTDWNKPTVAKLWTVKDVAAHLLDTGIRTIAHSKNYVGDPSTTRNSYQELVDYLNGLNADWVKAMKRVSPETLIDFLQLTQKPFIEYYHSLDLLAPAMFSVAWAGEQESKNWFHISREYTERWHHQQQIRDAVGQTGIMDREFFFPMIDTLLRALPYTYRETPAKEGEIVQVKILGTASGEWRIQKENIGWEFTSASAMATSTIELDADTAWKLFTKAFTRQEAETKVKIYGNRELALPLLRMVSVMG